MTRVLLTGAAGFIGSHALEALVRRGDTVTGIDNFDDYYAPSIKQRNLSEVRAALGSSDREVEVLQTDVRDRDAIAKLFAARRPEVVIHLAGLAGVRASIEEPRRYLDVNVGGTLNLLDAARDHGVANFVFASTSSVYGATRTIPFVESDPCDRPLAPYAASKRAAELLGHTYHHLFGVNFTALRFFTVYGPRNRPDMMAFKLLRSMYDGVEIPLYAGGKMHRDWTFVGDVAGGIVAAADRPLGYRLLNLGRGEPVLLADFVAELQACAGRTARLVSAPRVDADVDYTFADVSAANSLIGYSPKVSVAEGARALHAWYLRRRDDDETRSRTHHP